MKKTIGLFVMGYGSPNTEADLEAYYTHIRRGNKPSPEMVQALQDKYDAIGGISPLAKITKEQATGIFEQLQAIQADVEFKLYLGFKHIAPFLTDKVEEMKADGIEEAVCITLAPHASKFNRMSYMEKVTAFSEEINGPKLYFVDHWYNREGIMEYWTTEIKTALDNMSTAHKENCALIISGHSLPLRVLQGCPYPEQMKDTVELLKKALGKEEVFIGWQSKGATPDPWLGPDVQDLTRELHEKHGFTAFIYAPVGFMSEHLEVLFDNDIECKEVTDEIGVGYYRPKMPNADANFMKCLAEAVLERYQAESAIYNGCGSNNS